MELVSEANMNDVILPNSSNIDRLVESAAIVNPFIVLKEGWISPFEGNPAIIIDANDDECALQQNGIDLRLDSVDVAEGGSIFTLYKKGDQRCKYYNLEPDASGNFTFFPGRQYGINFMEWIEVPERMCAYIFMRSSINRYSGTFFSALWDAGFRGRLGGVFRPTVTTIIERGYRIAQIVFFKSDSYRLYDGQYQDQKTHQQGEKR